ncbi:MAG: hypothetical protein ACREM2_07335 [Vulcanimicrobiaceae bacterium]
MQRREPDPFFEQLKADIREGIDELDRGEVISIEEVAEHFHDRSDELRRQQNSDTSQ